MTDARAAALLADLRDRIGLAPLEDLPAIGGALESLRLEIQLRLTAPTPPPSADENDDRLLDVRATAELLGQKESWVRDHKDELPIVRLPRSRALRFSKRRLLRQVKRAGA
jgi:hypothetical protein